MTPYKLTPFFIFLFSCPVFAQFNVLQDLKNKTEQYKGTIANKLGQKMKDSKKEYDLSNFNYAISLADNAEMFESKERFDRQRSMLTAALSQSGGLTHEEQESQSNEAGEMLYANGKYKLAEKAFLEAKSLHEGDKTTFGYHYAMVISNLALLYQTMGKTTQSEALTLKALELRKNLKEGDKEGAVAATVNNLGVLYKDMGRFNESEQTLSEAVALNKKAKGDKSVPYAIALNNQAMLFQQLGRLQEAEQGLKAATEILQHALGEKSDNYLRVLTNLALLYQEQGKFSEAETIYKKAISIKEKHFGTNHPDYAHYLNNLAALYMLMGKDSEVESLLQKAAKIYLAKFGENHPAYASTISNLGNFYRIKGRNTEALAQLEKASAIRKSVLSELHPEYINSVYYLALIHWQMDKTDQAYTCFSDVLTLTDKEIQAFFAPMSENEKAGFWEKLKARFDAFYSFAFGPGLNNGNIQSLVLDNRLATKALLLNASNKVRFSILNSNDTALKNLYHTWTDQKEYLARLYTYSKQALLDEKINVDSVEKVVNGLEKELSLKSQLFNSAFSQKKVNWQPLAAGLGADEAAVEIVRYRKFNRVLTDTAAYAALVIKKSSVKPATFVYEDGNMLEGRYYKYYRNCIKQKLEDKFSYDQYWKPMMAGLNGTTKVYFSADGIFNQVNLSSLTPDGIRYVVDDKSIVLLSNLRDLPDTKAKPVNMGKTAFLMGNPVYGGSGQIANLPGTKVEIEKIKATLTAGGWTCRVLLQQDANEGNFKNAAPATLIHVATHGYFEPNVDEKADKTVFGISPEKARQNPLLRSGLLLTDAGKNLENTHSQTDKEKDNGILTAYEVMNLNLSKTNLVVLSACETGLGDIKAGEGVYGLQRAFLIAGANSLIMSLWTVNDAATQNLMSAFYANWLKSGNKQQAFRQAQLQLKAKFKEPYYWGAFVMVD